MLSSYLFPPESCSGLFLEVNYHNPYFYHFKNINFIIILLHLLINYQLYQSHCLLSFEFCNFLSVVLRDFRILFNNIKLYPPPFENIINVFALLVLIMINFHNAQARVLILTASRWSISHRSSSVVYLENIAASYKVSRSVWRMTGRRQVIQYFTANFLYLGMPMARSVEIRPSRP